MNTTLASRQDDNYDTLRTLLSANWGPEYKQELDAILSGPGNMTDKIAQIAKADARRRFAEKEGVPGAAPHTAEDRVQTAHKSPAVNGIPAPITHRDVARNQQQLRREYTVQNPISFALFELSKIRQFGLARRTIAAGFWGFLLKLRPETERYFKIDMQVNIVPQLRKSLAVVLKKAWLYLDKFDYNVLVQLDRLCDYVAKASFSAGSRKTLKADTNFHKAEALFLVFQQDPQLVIRSVESLRRVYAELDRETADKLVDPAIVFRLLGKTDVAPVFQDIVLGIAMVSYRRFLRMGDLMEDMRSRPLIHSGDFDCDTDVRAEIGTYVSTQIKSLEPMLMFLHELTRLRGYLPLASESGPLAHEFADNEDAMDYETLAHVYDGATGFNDYLYARDKDNMVLFCSRFIEVFLETFGALLTRGLTLDAEEKVELFGNHAYNTELARLQYCHIRLDKLLPSFPNFPRKRYAALYHGTAPTAFEAEAMNNFTSAADTFAQLGLGMVELIKNRSQTTQSKSTVNKAFPIPHESKVIAEKGVLAGKTVIEALSLFTRTSLLFALWLGEPGLSVKLKQEPVIRDKVGRILNTLERIATAEQYQTLRSDQRLQLVWNGE